jgi:hypothetical protein
MIAASTHYCFPCFKIKHFLSVHKEKARVFCPLQAMGLEKRVGRNRKVGEKIGFSIHSWNYIGNFAPH